MVRSTGLILPLIATLAIIFSFPAQQSTLAQTEPHARASEPYVFLQEWGNEVGILHRRESVAIHGGRIYVCDTFSDRIQVLDLHGTPPPVPTAPHLVHLPSLADRCNLYESVATNLDRAPALRSPRQH